MPTEKQIQKILGERYYLKSEKSWEDELAPRLSWVYKPIQQHIVNREFLPSSPTIMNANTKGERIGTFSSCFTMDVDDSIKGITDSIAEAAQVTKMAGGVGYAYDKLRGSNELVGSTGRCSGGPVPFIGMTNSTLDAVMQGGARRGAGMGQLNIFHPDILKFIFAKRVEGAYKRMNFSIRVPDKFYRILDEDPGRVFKTENVIDGAKIPLKDSDGNVMTYQSMWDLIIETAWVCSEPGIFNVDIASRQCSVINLNPIVLSNPCAEFTNIPYNSCNLGSIDVSKFVRADGTFDYEGFIKLVRKATKYLDRLMDKNTFPLDKISEVTLKTRPIGLGVMGVAHALAKMGMGYNSEYGFQFGEELAELLTFESMKMSIEMAKKDGAYPAFDYDVYVKANERFFVKDKFKALLPDLKATGIRNHANTSIAPTGTISYIANCSSGIEPMFALAFIRRIEHTNNEFEEVYMVESVFEEYLDSNYTDRKDEILKEVVANNGSCQKSTILTDLEKSIFVTSADIDPMDHLKMLGGIARNTSLSVSKTINLPADIAREKVSEVYREAWRQGIIGVTVYRDGSRDGILVTKKEQTTTERHSPKRPNEIECDIYVPTVNKKQYYVVVGIFDGKPYEIFTGENYDNDGNNFIPKSIKKGKVKKIKTGKYVLIADNGKEYAITNGHSIEEAEALSRQISLNLRHSTPLHFIVEQLQKNGGLINFNKALARTLKKYISDDTESTDSCPQCTTRLVYKEGCVSCPSCGFSKCA